MFKSKKLRQWPTKKAKGNNGAQVTIRANQSQIEELVRLGALTHDQAALGRQAGGLLVTVPAYLVAEFQAAQPPTDPALPLHAATAVSPDDELEKLVQRIDQAGLNSPMRLLLAGGRPVSFVSSQFLLMLQPLAQLGFGDTPATKLTQFSRLLENRANLDELLHRLEELDNSKTLAR